MSKNVKIAVIAAVVLIVILLSGTGILIRGEWKIGDGYAPLGFPDTMKFSSGDSCILDGLNGSYQVSGTNLWLGAGFAAYEYTHFVLPGFMILSDGTDTLTYVRAGGSVLRPIITIGLIVAVLCLTRKGEDGKSGSGADSKEWTCKCGTKNGADRQYCAKCGAKKETAKPSATEWVCTECGKKNKSNVAFCIFCGAGKTSAPATGWVCSCGKKNSAGALFCTECGKKKPEEKADKGWTCLVCGAAQTADAAFCSKCGTRKSTKASGENAFFTAPKEPEVKGSAVSHKKTGDDEPFKPAEF